MEAHPSLLIERVISEVLSPVYVVSLLLTVIAFHSSSALWEAALWSFVTVTLIAAIPFGYVIRGVRKGRIENHHVSNRQQRRIPLLICIASVVICVAVLVLGQAPQELLALVLAVLAGVFVVAAVTHWWKISVHTAVIASAATILLAVFGNVALLSTLLIPLVGWSRVRLREHTLAQVVAGAIVGVIVTSIVFTAVR